MGSAKCQRRCLGSSADAAILVVFPVLVGACQVAQLIAVVAQGAPKNNPHHQTPQSGHASNHLNGCYITGLSQVDQNSPSRFHQNFIPIHKMNVEQLQSLNFMLRVS